MAEAGRSIKNMNPSEAWPFDQAPNVAAITSVHITKQNLPILLVTHYEDDESWGFQSGLPVTTEDSQLVTMKTIMQIDSSVAEVSDLEPGWSAERTAIGAPWKRYKDEWEEEEN